jgi:hypothetical protein
LKIGKQLSEHIICPNKVFIDKILARACVASRNALSHKARRVRHKIGKSLRAMHGDNRSATRKSP